MPEDYEQDAINSYSPVVVAPFAVSQHTSRSSLDDFGVGLFGQATITLSEKLDLGAGARFDDEDKSATLENFFVPLIAPASKVEADETFSNVSPQFSAAYRAQPNATVYGTVGRGYKAGGFNPASPLGNEAYGEERTWHVEGGAKTLSAATDNAASHTNRVPAHSISQRGAGARLRARLVCASIGSHARPLRLGEPVERRRCRRQQDSEHAGLYRQLRRSVLDAPGSGDDRSVAPMRSSTASFQYNGQNCLGQEAYSLVNLRLAASGRFLTAELLVRNAFDTEYIPLAFPYPNFAPSGFMGEMGAPRTISFGAGIRF